MIYLKSMNIALRFLLEVSIIFLIGYWGFTFRSGKLFIGLFGIALPLFVMVLWALVGSPKAPYPLDGIYRLGLEIMLIFVACVCLYSTKYQEYTILYACISYVNLLLLYLWGK